MKRLFAFTLPVLLSGSETLLQGLLSGLALLLVGLPAALLLRGFHGHTRTIAALLLGGSLASACALALQALSFEAYQACAVPLSLVALLPLGLEPGAAHARRLACLAALAILLAALREGLGHGSLLRNGDWLFGPDFSGWSLPLHWPALTLAPFALLLLGLVLAALRSLCLKQTDR